MKFLTPYIVILSSILSAPQLLAQDAPNRTVFADLGPNDPILDDLYIELYFARWERAKAEVARQEAIAVTAAGIRARNEQLLNRDAIALEVHESSVRDSDIANLELADAQLAVEESRLLLDIAVDRISLGVAMPICADIRL